MRPRTLALLALAALGLGGYIMLFERPFMDATDPDVAQRLLPDFPQWKVSRIRLAHWQQPALELVRNGAAWRLRSPVSARADQEAVQRILAALEFVERLRSVTPQSNRRQLGLAPPQAMVELHGPAGLLARLELGRLDPSGRGVYLALSAPGADSTGPVVVVDRELWEAADLDADALRDRDLVRLRGAIQRINIEHPDGARLTLSGGSMGWQVHSDGLAVRAAPAPMRRLLAAVAGLRATRFLSRTTPLQVELRMAVAGSTGRVALRVGQVCPGRAAERVVSVADLSGRGSVTCCVEARDLQPFEGARMASLWDRQLTRKREAQLKTIQVTPPGGRQLELARRGGAWQIGGLPADAEVIRQWVASLAEVTASRVGGAGQGGGGRILLLGEEGAEEALDFGRPEQGMVPVRRSADSAALWVKAGRAAELLGVDALRFRKREVMQLSRHLVTRLETQRGGEVEVLERSDDGRWNVVRPVQGPADQQQVGRLLHLLSRLRARRFLAAPPPATRISLTLKVTVGRAELTSADAGIQQEVQTLQVTLAEHGPCHGLRGSTWFELGESECRLLARRRLDPRLLRFDEASLREIDLQGGGVSVRAEKRGPVWVGGSGKGQRPLPTTYLAELTALLRDLRGAEVLDYAARRLQVRLRVRIGLADGTDQTCLVDARGRAQGVTAGATMSLAPQTLPRLEQLLALIAAGR